VTGFIATQWAAYTKNGIPHKTTRSTPIKYILPCKRKNERTWLRKFGAQHNYMTTRKLVPRAYKARIINYTNIKGIYWTVDQARTIIT
jgi:hypothetical protein